MRARQLSHSPLIAVPSTRLHECSNMKCSQVTRVNVIVTLTGKSLSVGLSNLMKLGKSEII